jgi:hypothetical protein
MPNVLIIEKLGAFKELNIKKYNEEELYKKAGFKSNDGFKNVHSWNVVVKDKPYIISVYGKTNGRAGQENKYEFPPPIDNTLFFGNCLLTNQNDKNEIQDLSKVEWEAIYEELYGGFEDIGSEDSEEDDDSEENDLPRTKDGYVKDGFVIDDSDNDTEYTDEEEEEVIVPKKTVKKSVPKKEKPTPKKKVTLFDKIETNLKEEEIPKSSFLDCSKELEEEEYV